MQFSIVIVAKNAASKIGRLLESIRGLSDDVIVCDTGSTDNTISIARSFGAQVHETEWKGYGISKNEGISFARHDWILSLDSDEKVDDVLYRQLKEWKPAHHSTVYQLLWKNFFGNEWIRHCGWGGNWKNRLFHKSYVRWNDAIAHEDVISDNPIQYVQLRGYLEHYSFSDVKEYASKIIHSAMITAESYHSRKKRCSVVKLLLSPFFSFIKTYFIKTGFLDGRKGWLIAITTSYYTFIKYSRLRELNKQTVS